MGKKKIRKYLENLWGKEISKHRNFDLISFYHNYKMEESKNEFVDNETWKDLNLNAVFSKFDRNLSKIGQQYLFHIMHKYETDENTLKQRTDIANLLRENKDLREAIQIPLLNLDDNGAYFISNIIYGDFPKLPKYPVFFYFMSYLAIFSTILTFFNISFIVLALGCGIANFIINRIYTDKIYESFTGLSNLNKLIIASKKISKVGSELKIEQLERVKKKSKLLKRLSKKLGYFVIDKSGMNELALAFFEYANLILLFDLIAYLRSVTILEEHILEIREVFESVAELDMLISLASYMEENKKITTPKFVHEKRIAFEELYHPMVDNPVSNSTELSKSALITGSNMAGKTTFIKTIGVNIILAQSLYICHATKMEMFKYYIKTSIKREDSIENSKSYFFIEIEQIQKFIKLAEQNTNYLFLIDEIFRGTNTIERLATSTAVLAYLNQFNKTMVTTHDIELQYLLENKFDTFHFSEQVSDGKFYFDYKIERGNYSKGNAIKLLEIMGYPNDITDRANQVAKKLRERNPLNDGLFSI